MERILIIIVMALVTNNIVLNQSLGICPFLGVSKKTNSAVGMGLAVTFVIALACAICWIIYTYVLAPLEITFLQTIIFILIIACLVQLLDIVLKKLSPSLYSSLGIYLALITTNCAVLGSSNAIISSSFDLLTSVVYGAAIGLGFMLALILMAGIREKLERSDIPKPFRGFPITLITAAVMAMAFMGFANMVSL